MVATVKRKSARTSVARVKTKSKGVAKKSTEDKVVKYEEEASTNSDTTDQLEKQKAVEEPVQEPKDEDLDEKPANMSEYEWKRLQNIRQNEAQLDELFKETRQETRKFKEAAAEKAANLKAAKQAREDWIKVSGANEDESSKQDSKTPRKRRKRGEPLDETLLRRSSRVRGTKPESSGIEGDLRVDEKEYEEAVVIERAAPSRPDPNEMQARLNAVFAESLNAKDGATTGDEARDEAVRLWGEKVLHAEKDNKVDWKRYLLSRKPVKAPYPIESPLALMQERYADDTWKLLIACCLMSRVSSVKVKETAIEGFFHLCPHPSAALDANAEDVNAVLAPLGLFHNRFRSVLELSSQFLLAPEFQLDLGENKVYGFGAFAFDSYLMFTRGMAADMIPQDKNLRAYCAWAKKQAQSSS
mmetsp:Transcript_20986/g.41149  ORF Transcript_20986/g.41149 Transcript_20986/m.41149 type:complete len:414 (+) Transcript_20986:158-1399(+)